VGWFFTGGPLLPPGRWRLIAPLLALTLYALAQTAPIGSQATPAGNALRAISFDPYETRLVAAKLLALALTLALLLRHTESERRLRALFFAVVAVALAVPIWTALVLSNSRGGVLAMLCQLLFVALTFGFVRSGKRSEGAQARPMRSRIVTMAVRLALACALLAVIVFGVVWVGGDPLAEHMGSMRDEVSGEVRDPTRTGRAAIWQATWRLALSHPLVGVGFGGYWMAITETHDGSGALVPQQAHNDYLELLASGGVAGVALALWFVCEALGLARRELRDPTLYRRAVAFGALASLFGVAVHSLVDFGLHLTGNALISVALLALATARLAPENAVPARSQ
jgi:O-antigen ligase